MPISRCVKNEASEARSRGCALLNLKIINKVSNEFKYGKWWWDILWNLASQVFKLLIF